MLPPLSRLFGQPPAMHAFGAVGAGVGVPDKTVIRFFAARRAGIFFLSGGDTP